MSSSAVLTGYYRYTDIWFDWAGVLPNPEDAVPLKAILAHDALVHPDHPLHVEGVNGARMHIGTFDNGEARLLFSSAQVDYVRYWLHAMGMTKETIPLPYSDCLLTTADLRTVTTVVYEDGGSLRKGLKDIEKNNKRLKGSNPSLNHRRHLFERVRGLWAEKKGVWCALDFEAWERDHTMHTEFGWSLVGWKEGEKVEEKGHLIVEEAKRYTNGLYVPDYRYHYRFGQSDTVKRAEFKNRICKLFPRLEEYGPVYLVFHDDKQDIKYLEELNAPLQNLSHILPDNTPERGLFVVDTSDLIAALLGEASGNRRSLQKTCNLLQQETAYLHNAGNDAHYTLSSMIAMASGEQADIQRERRWPNQTTSGSVRVQLKRWQEDGSDYSDEEDEIPGPNIGYDPVTGKLYRTDTDDENEKV